MLHKTTTDIRAWSNVPGMQCRQCRRIGYPKSNAVIDPVPQPQLQNSTNETITLRLQDQTGFEMNVKMVNTVPLKYLMKTYAKQAKREYEDTRFLFDEEKLTARETPRQVCVPYLC
jgi:hypothetical protein